MFHRIVRQFATAIAEHAGVTIDASVYDKVRAFRAPNSRHPTTGLYKRHIRTCDLFQQQLEEIKRLAAAPSPFVIPKPGVNRQAQADWLIAQQSLDQKQAALTRQYEKGPKLNRQTLEFIREGAPPGERQVRLYAAAKNLGDFGCSVELARALLEEAALDSGLAPREVGITIEGALRHNQLNFQYRQIHFLDRPKPQRKEPLPTIRDQDSCTANGGGGSKADNQRPAGSTQSENGPTQETTEEGNE